MKKASFERKLGAGSIDPVIEVSDHLLNQLVIYRSHAHAQQLGSTWAIKLCEPRTVMEGSGAAAG
jgi:hypothetical protein